MLQGTEPPLERSAKFSEPEKLEPFKNLLSEALGERTPADIEELSGPQLRDRLLELNALDVNWIKRVNEVLPPKRLHRSCHPSSSATAFQSQSLALAYQNALQAEAEFWRKNEGYRVGPSDQQLGFDCGGQQWVLESCFPTGTLRSRFMLPDPASLFAATHERDQHMCWCTRSEIEIQMQAAKRSGLAIHGGDIAYHRGEPDRGSGPDRAALERQQQGRYEPRHLPWRSRRRSLLGWHHHVPAAGRHSAASADH